MDGSPHDPRSTRALNHLQRRPTGGALHALPPVRQPLGLISDITPLLRYSSLDPLPGGSDLAPRASIYPNSPVRLQRCRSCRRRRFVPAASPRGACPGGPPGHRSMSGWGKCLPWSTGWARCASTVSSSTSIVFRPGTFPLWSRSWRGAASNWNWWATSFPDCCRPT